MDRPSEVTLVVILLIVSAILNAIGAFTTDGSLSMLNMMPATFVSLAGGHFTATSQATISLGFILAAAGIVGKFTAGIALWTMVPWARKAAIGVIICLFLLGTGIKAVVVKTFVAEVAGIEQQRVDAIMGREKAADAAAKTPNNSTETTGAAEGEGRYASSSSTNEETMQSQPSTNPYDSHYASSRDSSLTATNTATDTHMTTETSSEGTPSSTESGETTASAEPAPSPSSTPDLGEQMWKNVELASQPNHYEELKSRMAYGLIYISLFGLLFAGLMIYLLSMEHVQQAFEVE